MSLTTVAIPLALLPHGLGAHLSEGILNPSQRLRHHGCRENSGKITPCQILIPKHIETSISIGLAAIGCHICSWSFDITQSQDLRTQKFRVVTHQVHQSNPSICIRSTRMQQVTTSPKLYKKVQCQTPPSTSLGPWTAATDSASLLLPTSPPELRDVASSDIVATLKRVKRNSNSILCNSI